MSLEIPMFLEHKMAITSLPEDLHSSQFVIDSGKHSIMMVKFKKKRTLI